MMSATVRDPRTVLLAKTRRGVLAILLISGAVAVLGAWTLSSRHGAGPLAANQTMRRGFQAALIGLIFLSHALRRSLASRAALSDPRTRASRFHLAHLVSAAVGALAVPLGIAYGFAFEPSLREVAPFWVAAAAMLALAFPRGYELDDFDEPLPAFPGSDHEPPVEARP